ncbi:MAG TPA: HD domain-containing protein [bacterium]|nr:HD domain-containing protein [bacterium]
MTRRKVKYFQDPLYGQIAVDSPLLLGLIDSRAVQRLRQIRQLGVSYLTFLGAEHSRFSHSLGAMTLMGRALDHLEREDGLRFSPEGRELALAAALLHDIGHCAFSHTLERVLIGDHERMGVRLLREDHGLKALLRGRAGSLAAIMEGSAPGVEARLTHDLLSSQLDVDRLDYLVRDAHYTGVNSGKVDLDRIIASLTVSRGRLAVKERGLLAVEEYFLARYFMYWKVYFHKTSRAMELLLMALLQRAKDLWLVGRLPRETASPALAALLDKGESVGVADFLDHDDSDVMVAIKRWMRGPDPVLAGLAERFVSRRKVKLLWEAATPEEDLPLATRRRVRAWFERRRPGSAESLLIEDRLGASPYDLRRPIMVVGPRGRRELSTRSRVVRDIAKPHLHARYYVPTEDLGAVQALLKRR